MNVASRGCYPCSGPVRTPLDDLWSHTHTLHKPVTADIIVNNGGTMESGAIIANTTQRMEVFTVHEPDVTRHAAAAAAAACADFLIRNLFSAHSMHVGN